MSLAFAECRHRRALVDRDGVVFCARCGAAWLSDHDDWGDPAPIYPERIGVEEE